MSQIEKKMSQIKENLVGFVLKLKKFLNRKNVSNSINASNSKKSQI